MTPRAHAEISPSSWKDRLACSGYVSDQFGDKTFSDRGELGHKAVEERKPELVEDDPKLLDAVNRCIKYEDHLFKSAEKVYREERVAVLDQWGYTDSFGLFRKGTHGVLCDFKFSYYIHEAAGPQFQGYVIGWFDRLPGVKTIDVHSVHPFLDIINVHKYHRTDYGKLVASAKAIIERWKKRDPIDLHPCALCKFCGKAGTCPALGQIAAELAVRYTREPWTLPTGSMHGSEITDPVAISALLKLAPALEKHIEGIKRAAIEMRLNKGVDIPDFDLVEVSGRRSITAPKAAWAVAQTMGITIDEFLDSVSTVSITGLEEAVSSHAPKGAKGKQILALEDALLDCEALTPGHPSYQLRQTKQSKSK